MWQDPIVEEVRQARVLHAARFNFDLQAIYQDLRDQEQKSERKVVSFPPKRFHSVQEKGQAAPLAPGI